MADDHPTLGYLVPEFPSQTHAFFWRELQAMRETGARVHLISTRRPADPCPHEFAKEAAGQTQYLWPFSSRALRQLAARPGRTLRAVGYVRGLSESTAKERAVKLGLIPVAAELLALCRGRGIEHIHIHSCAEAAHLGPLCRILGGPTYSLTLHGDLPVYGRDHRHKMSAASFVSADARPHARQVVERVGLPPERTLHIWMGVNTDQFIDAGRRSFEPGKLHLATVARLNMNKGHRFALAAMRRALDEGLDITYSLAGSGPAEREIVAEIEKLGLGDHVRMLGSLSESAVLDLLQSADAFVLPSINMGEAGPVSVMEAMSCGLPVICSVIGGTPDMIDSGRDGLLVEQRDVDGLHDAITQLARDPDYRRRIGEAARQSAIEKFDYRANARRLLDAIRHHRAPDQNEAKRDASTSHDAHPIA